MPDGHHPGTLQVTAMDDQFGTHTYLAKTVPARRRWLSRFSM
jgi:hypothetical protein